MATYLANYKVPPNTPKRSPAVLEIHPLHGIVRSGSITLPTNAANLVGVQLLDGDSRFYPMTGSQSEWAIGDGVTVAFDFEDGHDLRARPYLVKIRAYNEDDTFEREISVTLNVSNFVLVRAINDLVAVLRQVRR